MKKIFLMLMALFSAISSWSQTTVTIGTATTASNSDAITPYKTFWHDGRAQFLITAAEINAAGGYSANITNMAFDVSTAQTQTLTNFTIKLGHTTVTALTGTFQSNAAFTTCYTGNVTAAAGWNTYTFTNQFLWNGTSNMIVEVCFDNTSYTTSSAVRYSTTSFVSNTYFYSDNATGCTATASGSNTTRANMRFNFAPNTPCTAPPTGGTASATSTNPCPADVTMFSVSGGTTGSGLTYQWQSSTNNVNWSNITTAGTNSVYNTNVTSPIYYRRQITCSTQVATSSSIFVSPKQFFQCYCAAAPTYTGDSDIGKVKLSLGCKTILENGSDSPATFNSNATGMFSDFTTTVPAPKLIKGFSHDFELYYVSMGNYYQAHFNVFIDYNRNGAFEANERVANVAGQTGGAGNRARPGLVSFTVPLTADTGYTGMRIHMQEGGNNTTGPCGTFASWGEVEDYMIRIVNSPDVSVSSLVTPVNNQCGANPTKIIVQVKNNSTTDTSFYTTARTVVTGSANLTLNGAICRPILPGGVDTIEFPVTLNTIAGGVYTFSAYPNHSSDPNFVNDTTNSTVTISPLPATPTVVKGSFYNGTFDQGTLAQPDFVASNDTIFYDVTPPIGYTNATYGSAWAPAISVKTFTGTNLSNATLIPPAGGNNAKVRIVPLPSEVDSMYEFSTRFYFIPSNCDTTVKRMIYIAPRPVSKFNNTISCFGTATQFTDSTTLVRGTVTYAWDFGDTGAADTSVEQSPSYLFSGPGTYTVTLTTTSNLGYKNTFTKVVQVGYTPVPAFSYTNQCDGSPFSFKNNSTIGGTQTTMSYTWDFLNDNTSSTVTDASKTYSGVGSYDVKLTAKSVLNCQASITKTVNVFPVPNADFTVGDACTDKLTNLNNSSTVQYGDLGAYWTLGNGTNSTDKNPSVEYTTPGTKSVRLVITTEFGCIDSVTKTITVGVTPTTSFLTQAVCAGDSVVFSNTTTGSGTINSNWNFGDGNTLVSNSATVRNLYANSGSYTVTLNAANGNCQKSVTKTVDVHPSPEADFSTNGSACFGSKTMFNNNSSGSGLNNVWHFGVASATSTDANPSYTYSSAGTFDVKLLVINDKGCADSLTQQVIVYALPNSSFSKVYNTAPTPTMSRQRQVLLSPADSNYFSYLWNMGDGTEYNQVKPVHNYLQDGKYYITLRVVDNRGCENNFLDSAIFNLSSVAGLSTVNNSVSVFPNPFKNSTNISFVLAGKSHVSIKVYDMLGREVKALLDETKESGLHTLEFNTSQITYRSSGYIIRVTIDGKSYTKQVVEIK